LPSLAGPILTDGFYRIFVEATMRRVLTEKFLIIGATVLLLTLALMAIRGLMAERKAYHDQAVRDIATGFAGEQRIAGPVLVLPCRKKRMAPPETPADTETAVYTNCSRQLLPDNLEIAVEIGTETRSRGIYQSLLYTANIIAKGHFLINPDDDSPTDGPREWGQAYVAFGIGDSRGIVGVPRLIWNGAEKDFDPGTALPALGGGLHADIGSIDGQNPTRYEFQVNLALKGSERIEFVPIGKRTSIALQAAWRHPSFIGRYLPDRHEISADGFSAQWSTSFFATNMRQVFEQFGGSGKVAPEILANSLGVALIEPVDLYLKAERAVKYGFLFVVLTLACLFCTEVLKGLAIHPVQYGLVGIALALFFLLMLSLAEHIGFLPAYLLASLACLGQVCFYAASLLKSRTLILGFGGLLGALYAVLYALLASEDYALLMGSLLLFGLLSLAMAATRRVDWNRVGFKAGTRIPVNEGNHIVRD
jgi:inner membrane protein